jgi:hypothetical protein
MPETVRTLAWHGAQLVVGTKRHYCALTAASGAASGSSTHTELQEIFPLGTGGPSSAVDPLGMGMRNANPAPCLKPLPRSAEVLLLLDSLGVVTSMRGQPSGSSIAFSSAPLQLAQSSPYILAAMSDGAVEVYDRASAACVQSLPLQVRVLSPRPPSFSQQAFFPPYFSSMRKKALKGCGIPPS